MSYSILISISSQTLALYSDNQADTQADKQLLQSYPISSGLNGVGCKKNTGKTPVGQHIVRAKIGDNLPINSVLVGRRSTGEIYSAHLAKTHPHRDWVLSRILWLSGKEVGLNRLGKVDTMQRYIYIHGTPNTEPMGKPLSHGCIRMRNQDVIELFDLIPVGTEVMIQE